jgi:hypothetical protein
VITKANLDRVGVSRHAEAFETLEACRARFEELKAQLAPCSSKEDAGICLFTLRPGEGPARVDGGGAGDHRVCLPHSNHSITVT